MTRSHFLILFLALLLFCVGCSAAQTAEGPIQAPTPSVTEQAPQPEEVQAEGSSSDTSQAETPQPDEAQSSLPQEDTLPDAGSSGQEAAPPHPSDQTAVQGETSGQAGRLVVIDPGHQERANLDKEPIGPGASEMKIKVSGGTQGVATGIPEYDLALTVSLLLRDELEARGYDVLLVREDNHVDISNRERAEMANNAGADVFLRLHANGSDDPAANGAMTLCPTAQTPYPIGGLYAQCRLLSDCVLDEYTAATGLRKERVWETDTMSGLNWCQVPVTILEMGYMTNPSEDQSLNDPSFQAGMVQGIANGVDAYFARAAQ